MDISATLQAKSDQLNALDLGGETIVTVTAVNVTNTDQPVTVRFHGDNGKPWKPSLGMRRVLAECWGKDSSQWVGRSACIYCDPSVKWAGKEAGGIRIKALSHIDKKGHKTILRESRQKTVPYSVEYLEPQSKPMYPDDQFESVLPEILAAMKKGMTIDQVIAECSKVGKLTQAQLAKLNQR
ncbi:MAG: hypothetical protein KTR16_11535 [Acidiferrobacterales bacterium]|nr:hypothetical protein [Acidiferrobacterales bacterium]